MTTGHASEPLPASYSQLQAMRESLSLRHTHWDALVRLVISVRSPDDFDGRDIAWDRVTPRDLDAPITADVLREWLATRPPLAALHHISNLFDLRDPRAVTRADLVRLCAEVYPDALPHLLASPQHDPLLPDLYESAGEALGVVCAKRLVETPTTSFTSQMQLATEAAQAAYLRGAAEAMGPYELSQLGRFLSERAAVADATRDAYGVALVSVASRLSNKDARDLFVYTALASAQSLEGALRASTRRPKLWARLVGLIASQGSAQGATALAALLDDKKLAGHAAAALASMGSVGVDAARAWLGVPHPKAPRGAQLAQTLAALPPITVSLWAGHQRSLPRFGRSPLLDLRAAPEGEATPREPTALAALEAAAREKPARELLTPDGWADLLQIIALDPFLANVAWAYETALARGRLGRGNDARAMMTALDALHWDCVISHAWGANDLGIGHVLLWAGAERDVFQHAIGRFEATPGVCYLGARERHFTKALEAERPRWGPPLLTLIKHYGAGRDETAWLGPPPVIATLAAPGASVELAAPSADLWIDARVTGSTRFTLRFRGDVRVTVDVSAERWEVSGAASVSGVTPPLDPDRGVRLSIETARDTMYLGIDGAIVHAAISKVPAKVASVTVEAEGEGAAVTELTLYEKYTVRSSDAVGALFFDLDNAQGYAEVAGQKTPAAAHCLAVCALTLEGSRATFARDALLSMKGADFGPWQRAVRDGLELPALPEAAPEPKARKKKPEAVKAPDGPVEKPDEASAEKPAEVVLPTEFAVRSFEDVVRVFHDARLGAKAKSKKPAAFKRGQTEHHNLEYASFAPKPEVEDFSSRTAVPYPAVYLGDEAPSFDELEYFIDAVADLPALCRKGRGTYARADVVAVKNSYVVADMEVMPPSDYDDWAQWTVAAAAWKVDEGWAWCVMEGPVGALLPLINLRALPPRVEWQKVECAVGNW